MRLGMVTRVACGYEEEEGAGTMSAMWRSRRLREVVEGSR